MEEATPKPKTATKLTNHGMAAPVLRARGVAAMVDHDGNRVIVVQLLGDRGNLVIDAVSGASTRVEAPFATWDSPFAFVRSRANRLYTLFGQHFVEFNPETNTYSFSQRVGSQAAMALIEAPDGRIYAAAYPDSGLVVFDPESRELQDYGSLNAESWPQYIRSMATGADGWLYMGVGNVAGKILAFHPETEQRKTLEDPGGGTKGAAKIRYRAENGAVFGSFPSDSSQWFRLEDGAAHPIEVLPTSARSAAGRSQDSIEPRFPDGSEIALLDLPERFALIGEADGSPRPLAYDYPVEAGPDIYSIVAGPDGQLHGSTGQPLRVYSFDPEKETLINRGLRDINGHWNAVARQGEAIYAAQYGPGNFWRYDPALEWNPEPQGTPNPQLLAQTGPNIGRPHALLAHPDGHHLVMAGTPGYGRTGGGLLLYDTANKELYNLLHTELVPNHSTFSLAALPNGHLIGGTTRRPGTGGVAASGDARLYLFDMETRKRLWDGPVAKEVYEVSDLIVGSGGLVYGLATLREINGPAVFFVFDPEEREMLHYEEVNERFGGIPLSQAKRVMAKTKDGQIYVLFNDGIACIEPGQFALEPVVDFASFGDNAPPDKPTGYAIIHDGHLYFPVGSYLWSYQLPAAKPITLP